MSDLSLPRSVRDIDAAWLDAALRAGGGLDGCRVTSLEGRPAVLARTMIERTNAIFDDTDFGAVLD